VKKLLGIVTAAALILGLAACTASPDQTLPSPEEITMSSTDYLSSTGREETISDVYDRAERKISRALDAGTLTANNAGFGEDKLEGRKSITISQIDGSEFVIEGPFKGTSLWVITYDGKSSTNGNDLPTAEDIRDHDVAALNALEGFLADIG
jgi:hypothetical protein